MSDGRKANANVLLINKINRWGEDYYWVVGLVDSQDEDELREEECSPSVVNYAGLVALHGPQAEEENCGEEEEAQRDTDRAPRQELDGQNLPVLTSQGQPA